MSSMEASEIRRIIRQSMDADRYACKLTYLAASGVETDRYVSPVWLSGDGSWFRAMCLGRQDCRNFRIDRIKSITRVNAHDVLAPMPLTEVAP